jgi:hypothetical protein
MRINLFKANEARDKAEKVLLHKRNKFIENINFIIRSASKRGKFSADIYYEYWFGEEFLDSVKQQLITSGYTVEVRCCRGETTDYWVIKW